MYSNRIWSTPFLLELPEELLTEEESLELAYVYLLAERERKKDETLESISRFLLPLLVLPVDEERGLILDASGLYSSKIETTPLNLELPLRDLETSDFKSFLSVLNKQVKQAKTQLLSKPKSLKLSGWMGEGSVSDIRDISSKLREITDTRESEIIEPMLRLDDKLFSEVVKWFPKRLIVNEATENKDSMIRIIDSQIRSMEVKLSEMRSDFRIRESELRAEAQQKIESERENLKERLKRAEQEAFTKDFPQPVSSLDTHSTIISDKLNAIRNTAFSKDIDKVFEAIGETRKAIKEAEKSITEIEKEYTKFQKEIAKFYTQRDREIAAAEAEFNKYEKRIQKEQQVKTDQMQADIYELEELIGKSNELREELDYSFETWRENMENEIAYSEKITIPLNYFPEKKEYFTFYVPFYVIEYKRNRKSSYLFIPPQIPRAKIKKPFSSLEPFIELAKEYEKNLRKGKIFRKFERGLRENNILESPEKEQKLKSGIALLESNLHLDSDMMGMIREAYENRFEKTP